jgi:hypothetical protein
MEHVHFSVFILKLMFHTAKYFWNLFVSADVELSIRTRIYIGPEAVLPTVL